MAKAEYSRTLTSKKPRPPSAGLFIGRLSWRPWSFVNLRLRRHRSAFLLKDASRIYLTGKLFCDLITVRCCFWEGTVPIIRLAKAGGFAPEEITVLTNAFEDACRIVGLTDPTDRWRDIVAKTIIEAAQAGERDYERLRDRGVRAIS
jgi:hypothetical protein